MILLSRKGAPHPPYCFIGSLHALAISALLAHASRKAPTCSTRLRSRRYPRLLKEVEQNNPQIQAARLGTQAAREAPAQVTVLPDPIFQIQQVNVGSPRPFAGYTNSGFAYVGLGASQDIPYPGKLRLRGEIAKQDVDIARSRADSVSLAMLAAIKTAYYQLAYLSQTLSILESDREILKQVEFAADARYRSGLGNQQDILQDQFQQTKLLRDISMHHLEVGKLQARLKQLVNRSQMSSDIDPLPGPAKARFRCPSKKSSPPPRRKTPTSRLRSTPSIARRCRLTRHARILSRDFNVQAMWQRTDPTEYRAYYQITFGVKLPSSLRKTARRTGGGASEIEPRAQRPSRAIPAARRRPPRAIPHR